VGKTQNTIEINGKHYDAATGVLLNTSPKPAGILKKGAVMDGFVRHRTNGEHAVKPTKRPVQKANTLMRQAVKKPTALAPSHSSNGVTDTDNTDKQRQKRAHEIFKSPLIKRFSLGEVVSMVKNASPHHVADRTSRPENKPNTPTAATHNTQRTHQAANPKPARTSGSDLVEKALVKAQSHSQSPHHFKKRSRLARRLGLSRKKSTLVSAVLAALLLGTFFAYQNVPNFAMRIAAARAGFDANMPGYQPSGFSFKSPIKYSPGEVIVNFDSNTSDGRAFTLTERKTEWNSDDLRANFVQEKDSSHQTHLEANQVVYIYGDGDATWVNDGVWYQLESSASLTSDQIVRIAQSL